MLALALLVLRTSAQTPSTPGPKATVVIHVVDSDGKTVDNCRVTRFFRQDPLNVTKIDLDMTSHFTGLQGSGIPFGTYFCTLKRKLADGRDGIGGGRITVSRLEVYSVIRADLGLLQGVIVDGIHSPDHNGIRGTLGPAPRQIAGYESIWVHLSPVYAGEQFDIAVNPAGEFRIYDASPGLYTLTVVQGGRVLHTQPIEFKHVSFAQPIVVNMTNQPPDVIGVYESVGNINDEKRN